MKPYAFWYRDHCMFPFWTQQTDVYLEEEIDLRLDHFMLEVDSMWSDVGPWDEDQIPTYYNVIYTFKLFAYNELTQNYEIDITDSLTEEENVHLQKICTNMHQSEVEAMAEQRRDR